MKDIVIAKLIDGSYVVGKITKDQQIVEGVEMMLMPSQMGQMGVAMVPILYPFNKNLNNDIVIDYNKILFSIPADEDIINKYIETTIGIISPTSIITN